MGFNKRYISIEIIKKMMDDENKLKDFFKKADALIFNDNISIEIYNLIMTNKPYKHLIK
jgi:hypothetical protein